MLTLAAMLVVLGALSSGKAMASSWGVGVGVNVGPSYGYTSYRSGGHYATRVERVVVVPERHERVWVEPVYETRYSAYGPTRVVVSAGYYRDVCVPARYEDRNVSYWVEEPVYVAPAPVYVAPAPLYYGGYYGRPYGSSFSLNFRR